jgi:hypothetical protein
MRFTQIRYEDYGLPLTMLVKVECMWSNLGTIPALSRGERTLL